MRAQATGKNTGKKKKEEAGSFVPSEINIYNKSNFLIGSKYKSSLLENKIMAISLANSDRFETGASENESVYSRMNVAELRKALGANSGSFYQQLNQVAKEMTGKSIGMSSEDSRTFRYVAVVISAECKDGVFSIEYNHALRNMLLQLKRNYSRLNLSIMLKFTSNYSFRLYELLKSKCYHSRDDQGSSASTYKIRFSLSELKLELGIVNAELGKVKRVLNNQANPDFDKAVEISPEKMLTNWSDFKRKALDRAVNEINDISDLHVTYDTIKHGQGGKVYGVDFTVVLRDAAKKEEPVELTEDQKIELLFQIRDILGESFPVRDIRKIAEAADIDLEKIRTACDLLDKTTGVENPTGWLIKAIKDGYQKAEPRQPKKAAAKKGAFDRFEQQDYDFDSIEYAVLHEGSGDHS